MSFRRAALVAVVIGIVLAGAFSFAVIAYTNSVRTEQRRQQAELRDRKDKTRTDAEIKRIAQAVFRTETKQQRRIRIQTQAIEALEVCRDRPQCVATGRRLFGVSPAALLRIVRQVHAEYCAAHNACMGRPGAAGRNGSNGRDGAPGADGTNGRNGSSGQAGSNGTVDSTLIDALDGRVRSLELSVGRLLQRLCGLLKLCL